jgi:hypothetical protein
MNAKSEITKAEGKLEKATEDFIAKKKDNQ